VESSPAGPNDEAREPKCWHVAHALAGWAAFIAHLRHQHGVEELPEDDLEAWRVHEDLHQRGRKADP
jgi:hypothetical protein